MASYKETFSAYYDALTEAVDRAKIADRCEELMARTLKHGVQFTEGTFFGEGGEGFLRVNIGCPRRNITEGIHRLKEALDEAVEEKAHGVD